MSTGHDPRDDDFADDLDTRLDRRRREQLSALVDGELAGDQRQFLLRRLAHDEALAARWERWHLVGDVLRGEPVAALAGGAGGFGVRVAAAVAREPRSPAASPRVRWRHGVGAALAASVAAVAFLVARPVSTDADRPAAVVAVEAPAVEAGGPATGVPAPEPGPLRQVAVPQFADAVVPAPATPRPDAREARVARTDASGRAPTRGTPAPAAGNDPVAGDGAPAVVLAASDAAPFAAPDAPQARPWPRAALPRPGDAGRGDLTVGLDDAGPAPTFYPFEPRLPARDPVPGDTGPAAEPERSP